MPISVRPVAALDLATLERCSTVELAAFASDFHSLAFPGPFPEDRAETKAQALSTTIQNDGCRVFAAWAVDDEGSETLVGCARWFVYRKSMPEPELHSFGPGVHVAAATEMLGAIDGLRKANSSGKPCVYLSVLVVHPDYQGRGVGKLLMEWGLDRAAGLGVSVFLESSPAGRKLYTGLGFREVGVAKVPFAQFGLDKMFTAWAIIWTGAEV
ncbi:hypothetical protein VD0002_g7683 [Verticillium dahliae]|uniref:N-acetyltransferase domain-containing protein n=1 Tax=Verticillium dahliae TaxID=27337 RepID=A0AA45AJK4_VERDA|nr:hypothetical protein VdG2_05259 [Verticillium dahliae VDG2]KAH6703883.1 acyl-CoA N-acyltransferase [Verticillium dahliae]PNH29135.1 hypothetical protein BJF96_g7633 [Verticillium dahliae]PNH53613.1 hypothetical protein VD0003_g3799 [Verticillium dahliae]PNH59900.1 hypothetical protein VD0002_g7683 [Verticillium dahliae]